MKKIRLFTVEERRVLAENPHAPREILACLLYDEDEIVRMKAAANPNTPLEAIREYEAKSEKQLSVVEIRRAVAKNPHAPKEILARLLYDEDEIVRMRALANPNTPMEAIIEFAKEE